MKSVIIFALLVAVVFSDCMNPIGMRSEVVARFGGSANWMTTAAVSMNLGVCNTLLAGVPVCVSDAGFMAFSNWLSNFKTSFVMMGQTERMNEMGSININSAMMMPSQCIMTASTWTAFLMYGSMMMSSSSSTSGTVDFTSLSMMMQSSTMTNMYVSASSMAMMQAQLMAFRSGEATYTAAKAACTKAVFKHLIAVTCLGASSMYSTYVSGTMMMPMLKVKKSSCMVFQTACVPYYTSAMMQMNSIKWIQMCQSSTAMQVQMLLMNTTFSASVNTQLNSIYKTQVMAMATMMAMAPDHQFAGLMCNSSNTGASDCDFICQNVINATGIKMNTYNNLNVKATTRLLADASLMITTDNSGLAPEMSVMDSDANVGMEMQAGMSSAFGLVVSVFGLIGGLLLL